MQHAPRRGAMRNTQLQGEMKIMKHARTFLALALLTVMLAFPTSTLLPTAFSQLNPSTTWFVAPSPTGTGTSGGSCKKPGFNTISAAITAAKGGDIINVCPGTYVEQLTISKSLTIASTKGASQTIIQAPTTMAADTFGALNIVTVWGSDTAAELSGFTIAGPLSVTCNGGVMGTGVFVQQSAVATITNNVITAIHDSPIVQCAAYGIGILVGRNALSTTGTATISGNTISDYQKSAIIVDGAGSSATITGNTITGWSLALQASDNVQITQNAIQISRGASATVNSNTISTNECPNTGAGSNCGPDLINQAQASGIMLYQSGAGTTVTKNTLSANDIGILVVSADPGTTIGKNTVSGSAYVGILVQDGTNTVSGNTITGTKQAPTPIGIVALAATTATTVTATGSKFSQVTTSYQAIAASGLTATLNVS
jgi:parallel beta-helix repeat protein